MIIHKTGQKTWTNRHQNFTQAIDDWYDLADNNSNDILADYNDATLGIQGIIKEAITAKKRLKAIGGEWSFSKIAASEGILLNTKPMNISFRIGPNNVASNYAKSADDLYFAQCGVSVKELNDRLAARSRSLPTTGASNGQSIAGAIATGVHGSAIGFGSIQDAVVGLHLIVSPTRHVWLEKKSYPVVSASFVANLKAELVQDDALFNSALVGLGAFGFVQGVMLETVPLFLNEAYRYTVKMDADLFKMMETLDFQNTAIKLPYAKEQPYHFQVLVNPYNKDNEAYITVMYKRPFAQHTMPALGKGLAPGDDTAVFLGKLLEMTPGLIPVMMNTLIGASYPLYSKVIGTQGETFFNTDLHGKMLSTALGVPLAQVNKVRVLLNDLNAKHGPFPGLFSFRYVKSTNATLGFTCFEPYTCIIEVDTAATATAMKFYELLWDELEQQQIAYTFHWGKLLKADAKKIERLYTINGKNRVSQWIQARNSFIKDAAAMAVFNNEYLEQLGLATIF